MMMMTTNGLKIVIIYFSPFKYMSRSLTELTQTEKASRLKQEAEENRDYLFLSKYKYNFRKDKCRL
jgi:hypothetical protein